MAGDTPKITRASLGLRIQDRLWLSKSQELCLAQGFLFLNEPHVSVFIKFLLILIS